MKEIRTQILEKADKLNCIINGLDAVPWIIQGRPLFDFEGADETVLGELGQSSDDLFRASGIMNIAVFPDGRVEGLKTVSSQYNLLQHLDAINLSLDNVPDAFQLESININVSPDGGRLWAKMESGLSEEIIKGDKIKFRATLQNSADTSKVLRFVAGAFRLVCKNGMVSPDNRFEALHIKKLHKSGLDFQRDCQKFFENMDASFQTIGIWKEYATHNLTAPALDEVFEELQIGPRVQEELKGLALRGQESTLDSLLTSGTLTAWDAYNAFTQRITDSDSLESVKMDNGTRVSNTFDKLIGVNAA